jgi:hypothetical protein
MEATDHWGCRATDDDDDDDDDEEQRISALSLHDIDTFH